MATNEGTITRATGVRTAQTVSGDALLKRDVSSEIFWKEPERATLLQIMMGSQRVIQDARFFEWLEEDLDPRYITLGAITPGAGTTGTVALTDADVITVFAGMTVGQDPATAAHVTAVVTTIGSASMTLDNIVALTAGKQVLLGASVVNELSTEPTPLTRQPAFLNNNMFTARNAWGLSGWVMSDDYYGGKPQQTRQRERCKLQHKISLDVEAYIGRQPATALTLNSQNILYTDGIFAQQRSNVTTIPGGILTWPLLNQIAQSFDRLMSTSTPYLFVSRAVHAILDNIAYGKWTPNAKKDLEDQWGLEIRSLALGSKRYKVVVVDHWAGPDYGTVMVAVDPNELTLRSVEYKGAGKGSSGLRWMIEYMRGMDITGTDGTTGCFLTDMGVRLRNEQGTWRLGNVQTY